MAFSCCAEENSYRVCDTKGQIENVRGGDGSEPTIPCCSNPDYKPTKEQYQKYLELYES